MKQVRRKHLGYAFLVVVVAALAFLAAGCGGDGDSSQYAIDNGRKGRATHERRCESGISGRALAGVVGALAFAAPVVAATTARRPARTGRSRASARRSRRSRRRPRTRVR